MVARDQRLNPYFPMFARPLSHLTLPTTVADGQCSSEVSGLQLACPSHRRLRRWLRKGRGDRSRGGLGLQSSPQGEATTRDGRLSSTPHSIASITPVFGLGIASNTSNSGVVPRHPVPAGVSQPSFLLLMRPTAPSPLLHMVTSLRGPEDEMPLSPLGSDISTLPDCAVYKKTGGSR